MDKTMEVKESLFHIVKRNEMKWWQVWIYRIGAILLGILVGCIMISGVSGEMPHMIILYMFQGCFGSSYFFLQLLRDIGLLLLVGLALIPAFKMKFWNLGGNGQILMGALAAIMCMCFMGNAKCPDWVIILTMIPCSLLAGAVWAVIPAIFKAFFNTNESLFTLMMNYIAAGIVAIFLSAYTAGSGSGTLPAIEAGNLPKIGGDDFFLTIIVAVVVLILVFCYLSFTHHGYEIDVVGESQNTARYIGINVKKVIIRTLVISGAICGLVGLLLAAGIDYSITEDTAMNMGFTAIMTSWLAQFNPFVMVGTTFVVCFLNKGMSQVQRLANILNSSLSNVVLGFVYFFIIGVEFFINYKIVFRKGLFKDLPLINRVHKKDTVKEEK